MISLPELSIVVTSRNDDHGGNLKKRMRLCFNGIFALSARHKLKCELIIVEWNPPAGRPKLADVLPWPEEHPYCTVRIIEVPPEIHRRYKHAAQLPLYQMIAKNVGIRRARGRMVLATNIDILFTDAMFAFLASGAAKPNKMYRCDRYDTDGDIPEDADIDTQLRIAKETTLRVAARGGTWNRRTGDYSVVNGTLGDGGEHQTARHPLHTNACGDFTLMSRDDWFDIKAHWELDVFSFHLDSLLCYSAFYAGIDEVYLPDPMWCHHIEHTAGWTPEIEASGVLEARLDKDAIERITNEQLDAYCSEMMRKSRPMQSPNNENWGLAAFDLFEDITVRAQWDAEYRSIPSPHLTVSMPAVPYRYAKSGVTAEPDLGSGIYLSIVADARIIDAAARAWQANMDAQLRAAGLSVEIILVEVGADHAAAQLNSAVHQASGKFLLFTHVGAAILASVRELLAERRLDPDCFYCLGTSASCAMEIVVDPLAPLAENEAEAFLLLARERFADLRGFPDVIGSRPAAVAVLMNMAHAGGMTQAAIRSRRGNDAVSTQERSKIDTMSAYRAWCDMMMRQRKAATPNSEPWANHMAARRTPAELIEHFANALQIVYFHEQSAENLEAVIGMIAPEPRTIIVFGVGYGILVRALVASSRTARIVAVASDLADFNKALAIELMDLSRVQLIETNLSKFDARALCDVEDNPLVLIDRHLMTPSDSAAMWGQILPSIPPGSRVVLSHIWTSPHRLDEKTAHPFFVNRVFNAIDPILCFEASYSAYRQGGSIMGPGNIAPLVDWVNRNRISLSKYGSDIVTFIAPAEAQAANSNVVPDGTYFYNPASSWRWVEGKFVDPSIRRIISHAEAGEQAYAAGEVDEAAVQFGTALVLYERITESARGLSYKMDEADKAGDRALALRYFDEWQRAIYDIGLLEGAKRILVACEVRRGNLKEALEIPTTIRVDYVDPNFLNHIQFRLNGFVTLDVR